MRRPRPSRPSGLELCDAVRSLLAEYEYGGSPKTVAFYKDHVERAFLNYFHDRGIRVLEQITPDLMREYFGHERRSTYTRKGHEDTPRLISNRTLRCRYFAARRFFAFCVDEGLLEHSPMDRLKPPKEVKTVRKGFERDEARLLTRSAGEAAGWLGTRDRAILSLMIGTGCRAGELLAMTPACFNLATRTVVLHGKGGQERRARLGTETTKALKEYDRAVHSARIVGPPGAYWLTLRRTRLTYAALWSMTHKLTEYAEIENVHPHRFRHTFAAQYTAMNRDVMATKARLGHAKIQTTQDYLHSLGVDYGMDENYRTPDELLR